jgi:hypothetical protein
MSDKSLPFLSNTTVSMGYNELLGMQGNFFVGGLGKS